MNKQKLQWKVFAYLLVFCLILISILWTFQTLILSDMYKLTRKMEIQKSMDIIEREINNPDLRDILLEIEQSKEIIIRPSKEFEPPPVHYAPEMPGRKQPETMTQTRTYQLENGNQVSLTFYAMITPVDATLSTLKIQLYLVTGIMLVIATGLAILISKKISRPIEEINQTAKELAKGNYDLDFAGTGYLEINELSKTLNIAARELSKVENLRRELLANISHDLRTPLALIYSYAEMMQDFPEEVTSQQSQVIMDEAKRLTSLVNDILDISKLEAEGDKLNLKSYNVSRSLADTVERIGQLVKSEGYQIDFDYDQEIYLEADELKITQAFYNLLLNAITHAGPDKKILVRQTREKDRLKIEIIDWGEGIKEEDLDQIWDRYYKASQNHKRAVMGTGLGLSIVKKIIDMHGGDYGVESTLGAGSKFWFIIGS